MSRTRILFTVICLVVVACDSSDTAAPPTTASDVTTTEDVVPKTTTSTVRESEDQDDPIEIGDEVLDFVAALDELLVDTEYEDLIVEEPEVFVATGLLFCEQLAEEVDPLNILTEYVETLTGGGVEDADEDKLILAGSILGTAVGFFCPEHTELVQEGL